MAVKSITQWSPYIQRIEQAVTELAIEREEKERRLNDMEIEKRKILEMAEDVAGSGAGSITLELDKSVLDLDPKIQALKFRIDYLDRHVSTGMKVLNGYNRILELEKKLGIIT